MSYIGTYSGTIYHNPVNKYCVIDVKTLDQNVPQAYRSKNKKDHCIHFIAIGYGLPRTDTVQMELEGEWENGKYGYRFHVSQCRELIPDTSDGIQGYLSSGLFKGLGPKLAADIVKKFGKNALIILEKEPERYLEIAGITEKKLADIRQSYVENRTLQDIMILLTPFHLTPKTALRIYQEWGASSIEILKKTPYELCQISGFGFRRVDSIVRKTNHNLHDPMRFKGAILCALLDAANDKGHLYLAKEELKKQALSLLNAMVPSPKMQIKDCEIEESLSDMILHGSIVCVEDRLYLPKFFCQEDETARSITKLLLQHRPQIDITDQLQTVISESGLTLSKEQQQAVEMAFHSNLSIITGSPGTGKTTVLKIILALTEMLTPEEKIILMAPTGRASRNMAESTGFSGAKTMHSVLHLFPQEKDSFTDSSYLDASLIIVDEFSMADMWLAWKFFSRVNPSTKVILVGDPDQLPSVGPGAVFSELIQCGLIPVTKLVHIFRQTDRSNISYNAALINQGETRLIFGNDFQFYPVSDQAEAAEKIYVMYRQAIQEYGMEHVQILCPFRSLGEASSNQLNLRIQETLNPFQQPEDEIHVGSKIFRKGDRVIQTKNADAISNGDFGFLVEIEETGKDFEKRAVLIFGRNRVTYSLEALGNVELAYATTIHKMMGSETEVVLIPILKSQYIMLYRNLIYTAITRAKKKVILVGQKAALYMAIHRADTSKRNTYLGQRIKLYVKAYRKVPEFFSAGLKDAV